MKSGKNSTIVTAVIGGLIVMAIFVVGTILTGQSARHDTEKAVRSVSILYLDELAGRREQVVSDNLNDRISDLQTALELMTDEDLSDKAHMEAYQARMKRLFNLERFAFVDEDGLIYTATGMQNDIDQYKFDYLNLKGPEISIKNLKSAEKHLIIAVPTDKELNGKKLKVCFMEISMEELLNGVSIQAQDDSTTFCNLYTSDGVALSNTILGGLAVEDNLLDALKNADFEKGYSYDGVVSDFESGRSGVVSFVYNGIRETLNYVPVNGTDWFLTYLIRESVISDQISSISAGTVTRSFIQSLLTVAILLVIFLFIIRQIRQNAKLVLQNETAEAENRVKQQELEQRIALQDKLLEEEKRRTQQDQMITALASDYRTVYHIDLDRNDGVCYRSDPEDREQTPEGTHFPYLERFTWYAEHSVAESYREGFLKFIDPDNIREGLKKEEILVYRYLAQRADREYYEMIRVAGVRHAADRDDSSVHAIGLGLTVIDAEMREAMDRQQVLSDALASAEQANRAKTAFLSSMSHEIRTPMNAIIGLDSIALNDPETPPKTREYLEKIGGSAEHLLNLINDILDMSRIESGRMTLKNEEFSFSELLEAVNTMFSGQCKEHGLDYDCRIIGEVDDHYIGDSMKLRQVLINILGNAVKFTPEGGSVTMTVRRQAQFDRQSTLCFAIADTGIGISADYLPHIFDAFSQEDSSTTNKYGSSGLGMAITKSIVEMMNGNIQVESEKGKGSTFTVTVTLADSEHVYDGNRQDDIQPSEMTVLVVDDDPIACEHAKLVLEQSGIAAEIATSGAEAIEMVSLRHARRTPYNLILVDWQMPEMDGVETTRRIRKIIGNESAIIILTAYRWDDVLEEATDAGVDSFIAKPIFAASVMEEFHSAVKRKSIYGEKNEQKADLTGRHILMAEDIEVNAEIMKMVLQMRQMECDVAVNGRIAVETFEQHPPGYYDAILMDMRMPEMDGLEATRVIRAMDREDAKTIPIIALTANAFDEDVQRSMQAGLNAHLSKPVQPEVLYETLESLIPADR